MATETFDAIVVGGGSGGLACAKRASRLGVRVALIERAELGGTCVNRGCVPKKLLWEAAHGVLAQRRMAGLGLSKGSDFDLGALRRRIDRKIAGLRDGFDDGLAEAGVTLIRGTAEIVSPGEVHVAGRTLSAGKLVLATGASPRVPDIEGAQFLDTSDEVLNWTEVPERIVILGGGYVGCEFASIYAALGAAVTLVEPSGRLLGAFDEGLAEHAAQALRKLGVRVLTNTAPTSVGRDGDWFTVALKDGGNLTARRVVAATGRQASIKGLGPISERVELADSGALRIDETFQTSVRNVHAIGDAADRLPLTPVATRDGETLAEQLFGAARAPVDLSLVATTAFLFPPHAQVGDLDGAETTHSDPLGAGVVRSEDDAEDADMFRMAYSNDRLTGVALATEGAGDIIAAFGALIAAGAMRSDLEASTGVHPTTIEEIVGR